MDSRFEDSNEARLNLSQTTKSDYVSTISNNTFLKENQIESKNIQSIKTTNWRWLVLFWVALMALGGYMCFDMPNALSDKVKKYITHEENSDNEIKYNLFYSVLAYPNTLLPLFAGVLVDKMGFYFSMLLFSGLDLVGQSVFMIAGYMGNENQSDNLPLAIALCGRFIYGLGGESLLVCKSAFITKWFMEKELSLALGTVLSICWLGTTASGYTIPPLSNATSLGFALTVGSILCAISFFFTILLVLFDKRATRFDEKNGFTEIKENEKFHFKDIKDIGMIYWLIVLNCIFCYSGMMFFNISNEFFRKRYGFSQVEAGRIGSSASLASIVFAPMFGYLCDRFGNRVSFTILSTSALVLSHVLFLIIPSSNSENTIKFKQRIVPLALMGIANSVYAAVLFPMIPMVVEKKLLGTAYGLCSSLMNIGLSIGPIMVGALTYPHRNENAYIWVNVSLGGFCALGVLCSFGLLIFNKTRLNGILQKPSKLLRNINKNSDLEDKLNTKN